MTQNWPTQIQVVALRVTVKGTGSYQTDLKILNALGQQFNPLGLNIVIEEEALGNDTLHPIVEADLERGEEGLRHVNNAAEEVLTRFESTFS